jgi:hypothetical protein
MNPNPYFISGILIGNGIIQSAGEVDDPRLITNDLTLHWNREI